MYTIQEKKNSNNQRSQAHGTEMALNTFLTELNSVIDEDEAIELALCDSEFKARAEFLTQISEAFTRKPDLAGIIHGVRHIALGKSGSRSAIFPSSKNALGGMHSVSLLVESRMEARYAMELERDPNVLAFRSQAVSIQLSGGGQPNYPDFLIIDWGGRFHIREVKQNIKLLDTEILKRYEQIKIRLKIWGISFSLVDIDDVATEKGYENLQFLNNSILKIPSQLEVDDFLKHEFKSSTYGALRKVAQTMELPEAVISYLLFTGVLKFNLEERLTERTVVTK